MRRHGPSSSATARRKRRPEPSSSAAARRTRLHSCLDAVEDFAAGCRTPDAACAKPTLPADPICAVRGKSKVRGFLGAQQLDAALTGMDLVIIPAGVPRKPGMTRDDLFNINAGIVRTLCEGVSRCCPNAIVNLISNPVNSTVPIAAEVFKKAGTYDPKRLLGVTTLDVARANTFVAEVLGVDPRDVSVPVVGGHAGVTILPLLSQVTPPSSFTQDEIKYLTDRIQNGGTEVVEAKAGSGSATLSMAFAAAKFGDACLRAMRGDAGIVECSYVASEVTELPFFASKVRLGRGGAEEILPLGPLNDSERAGLEAAKKELSESIQKGIAFVNK